MFFLFPFAPDNLVSRDGFGRPVPCQAAHSKFSVRRDSSRFPRRLPFIYFFNRHKTPSGQSRVYRATQLRTDGVHCRESAIRRHRASSPQGSSSGGCCLFRYHHRPTFVRLASLFPHLLLVYQYVLNRHTMCGTESTRGYVEPSKTQGGKKQRRVILQYWRVKWVVCITPVQ